MNNCLKMNFMLMANNSLKCKCDVNNLGNIEQKDKSFLVMRIKVTIGLPFERV